MSTSQRIRSEAELSQLLDQIVRSEIARRGFEDMPGETTLDAQLLTLIQNASSGNASDDAIQSKGIDTDAMFEHILADLGLSHEGSNDHVAATADGDMTKEDSELDRLIQSVLEDLRSSSK